MSSTYRYQIPVEQTQWKFEGQNETILTWEYEDGREKLLNLYDKGKKQQWDAATRIDWSQDLDPENPMMMDDRAIQIYGSPVWERLTPKERTRVRHHLQAQSLSQFMHGEQVRMKAEEGRLPLDGARGLEQALPLLRVGPAPLEVREEPGGAFDSHQLDQVEACLDHLAPQLVGSVEKRRGDVVLGRRVPVLAVAEVSGHDRGEIGIAEQPFGHAGQQGGVARGRRRAAAEGDAG